MGGMVMAGRAALVCLALAGCDEPRAPEAPPVVGRYRPYAAQTAWPSTEAALVVGEGDLKALTDAGGALVGMMMLESRGGLEREDAIEGEARRLAARRGGTHVVQKSGDTEHRPEPTRRGTPHVARYRVVHYDVAVVPSARWGALPPHLRPPPIPPPPPPAPASAAPPPPAAAPSKPPPERSRLPNEGEY
jgi:hypothetical protein